MYLGTYMIADFLSFEKYLPLRLELFNLRVMICQMKLLPESCLKIAENL